MVADGQNPSAIQGMISLNNHGVQLLANGDFHGARHTFYLATDRIQDALHEQERQMVSMSSARLMEYFSESSTGEDLCFVSPSGMEHWTAGMSSRHERIATTHATADSPGPMRPRTMEDRPKDDRQHTNSPKHHRRPSATTSADRNIQEHVDGLDHSEKSDLFSFLRPILIRPDDFVDSKNPPLMQLCVCLLFNLAITSHTMTLLSGPPRTSDEERTQKVWNEAIYFYRLAYNLQVDGQMEASRLHTFAIVNNLGQLYHFAGKVDKSKECFQKLLLMIAVDVTGTRRQRGEASAQAQAEEALQAQYIQLFLDNVFDLFACCSDVCHSAAA